MHAALFHTGSPLPRRKFLGGSLEAPRSDHGARCSATPVPTQAEAHSPACAPAARLGAALAEAAGPSAARQQPRRR